MTTPYELLTDLASQIEVPTDGTLSRTIHQDERLKAVLFHFSAGQELSEHTASTPAVMHFLERRCRRDAGWRRRRRERWYVDSYAGSTSSQHSHQDACCHVALADEATANGVNRATTP